MHEHVQHLSWVVGISSSPLGSYAVAGAVVVVRPLSSVVRRPVVGRWLSLVACRSSLVGRASSVVRRRSSVVSGRSSFVRFSSSSWYNSSNQSAIAAFHETFYADLNSRNQLAKV